jgi:hypothetical protein
MQKSMVTAWKSSAGMKAGRLPDDKQELMALKQELKDLRSLLLQRVLWVNFVKQ